MNQIIITSYREWSDGLLTNAVSSLNKEFLLPANAPGGMVKFRRTLCASFFFKFYTEVMESLQQQQVS